MPPSLKVGAAQVDITPPLGKHISGAVSQKRPCEKILEPLYAKALVLECDDRRLAIVVLDVTIITEEYTARIREAASELGFAPESVMVHATQTHTAPALGHFLLDPEFDVPTEFDWLRGATLDYAELAVDGAVRALRQAAGALEPVEMGCGAGIEGRVAFNRRAVMQDGSIRMPGVGWPQKCRYGLSLEAPQPNVFRYIEGPIDPEVGVTAFRRKDGTFAAMLLHYTCHPVNVFPDRYVSPDWPGIWCDEMRRKFGGRCIPLVINGPCGNINPWDPFDPNYRKDHQRMGRILASTAKSIVEDLVYAPAAVLDGRTRAVQIPLRRPDPCELAESQKLLAEHLEPIVEQEDPPVVSTEWARAANVQSLHLRCQREPKLDYEIQALRIGDLAIVGLPGEPFVELGLKIKMESPTYPTYVAHCTSHYVGYIPTREAFARGGHEVRTSTWSKLVPEAFDSIAENATGLLQQVLQEP